MSRKKRQPKEFKQINVLRAGAKGKAIAKAPDGKTLFIKGAVPGDVVDVRTIKKRKTYYEAIVTRYISLSEKRITPVCDHFSDCGGCQWQNMNYNDQLYYKQNEVVENIKRIGKVELPEVTPILPSERIYHYRNKMEFSFSPKRWLTPQEIQTGEKISPAPACGFHISGMWDKILDIENCHLQEDPSDAIRNFIKNKALEWKMSFYDPRTQEGLLRSLMIRNTTLGEWMVLVQFHHEDRRIPELLEAVYDSFPVDSLLYVINSKQNDTLYDLPIVVFKGKDFIKEKLGSLYFRIHAKSFFQTNTLQAEQLYGIVKDYAALTGTETVYDLYTGAGSIALFIADSAGKVIGIESVPEAIDDAHVNAEMNKVDNVSFIVGDMRDVFNDRLIDKYGKPDLIIVDPPRAGMHPKVVNSLLSSGSPRIIYVSCNSATQARDLEILKTTYHITRMQPVDMFPQTYHVENVVLLEKI